MTPKFSVLETAFEALNFLTTNAAVFRKYFVLPFIILVIANLLNDVPILGLSALTVGTVMATTLATVSVCRFYRFKDPERVSANVNRAFGRLFFVTFVFSCAEVLIGSLALHGGGLAALLPMLLILGLWLQIKLTFVFPALALDDHQGSVKEVLIAAFSWSEGLWFRLLGLALFSYGPMIFVVFAMRDFTMPAEGEAVNLVGGALYAVFSAFMQIFCTMWISTSLTMIYENMGFGKKS